MFDQAALDGRYASMALAGLYSVKALMHGGLAIGELSGMPNAFLLGKALKAGEIRRDQQ